MRKIIFLLFQCTITMGLIANAQPPNDDPCNATILPVNTTCSYSSGTNLNATATAGVADPSCNGNYNGGDVWFQAIVPINGIIKISTQATATISDGAMALYTGSCNSLTEIACDRNSAPGSGSMPEITATGLVPGSTIWIRFWESNNNDQGNFDICATSLLSPSNDEPCNAIELTVGTVCNNIVGSNVNATASAGVPAPGCGSYSGGDVWYKAIVPANGHLFFISSAGTLTNGAIALYQGTCNALTLLACENTQGPGEWGEMSFVNLTPGETIWVRVWDENNNDQGDFNICVTSNPITTPPTCSVNTAAGDECSNAISICSLDGYCGNTISYTYADLSWTELTTAFQCVGPTAQIQNNSFLKFTATATTADFKVWVTATTKGIGIQMMFFEAANCGSGPVICHGGYDDIRPGPEKLITATGLTPGNTYYLMIDGVSNDQCTYVIKAITPTVAPTAGTLSGNQYLCSNQLSTAVTFTSTQSGGSWTSSNNAVATINASTGAITPLAAGTTTMTYTVLGVGVCPSATGTRSFVITDPPIAGTLSGTQNICITNNTNNFTSTVSGGTWTSSNTAVATINPSSGLIAPVATGTATMTYTVTGTGGCANASITRDITIVSGPSAAIQSNNGPICAGTNAQFTISGTAGATVFYALNGITGSAILNNTGTTIISITNANSNQVLLLNSVENGTCIQNLNSSSTLVVQPIPNAGMISGPTTLAVNETNTYSNTISGGVWSTFPASIATIATNGTLTALTEGTVTINYQITDAVGCSSKTSYLVSIKARNNIYYIPNAFIPGQGNDVDINTLKLYGPDIKSATMKIFNQWGQCIFESENPKQKGWDGKFKGVLQPSDVYIYGVQIIFNDGSTISKTGSINLIR